MLDTPHQFGALIRQRRKALNLTQEELALTVPVGTRFIAELEAGKPSCQLGKALAVARALGVDLVDAAETHRMSTDRPPPQGR